MESNNNSRPGTAIVALVISALALLISFASFYYQNIRKCEDVKATIARAMPTELLFTADVVFTNNGNQQCSIISVDLERENLDGERFPLKIVPCSNCEAFTIKENDVITRQFEFADNYRIISNSEAKQGNRFAWRLVYSVVDSEGKYHRVKITVMSKRFGYNQISDVQLSSFPRTIQILPSDILKQVLSFPQSKIGKTKNHNSPPIRVSVPIDK
jgi:hypothetical protein